MATAGSRSLDDESGKPSFIARTAGAAPFLMQVPLPSISDGSGSVVLARWR